MVIAYLEAYKFRPISNIYKRKMTNYLNKNKIQSQLINKSSQSHLDDAFRRSDSLATSIGSPKLDINNISSLNNNKLQSLITKDLLNQRYKEGKGLISGSFPKSSTPQDKNTVLTSDFPEGQGYREFQKNDSPGVFKLPNKEIDEDNYYNRYMDIYKNAKDSEVLNGVFRNSRTVDDIIQKRAARTSKKAIDTITTAKLNKIKRLENRIYGVAGLGAGTGSLAILASLGEEE